MTIRSDNQNAAEDVSVSRAIMLCDVIVTLVKTTPATTATITNALHSLASQVPIRSSSVTVSVLCGLPNQPNLSRVECHCDKELQNPKLRIENSKCDEAENIKCRGNWNKKLHVLTT